MTLRNLLPAAFCLALAGPVYAASGSTALGGAIGGAAGAVVGEAIGGREGAVIGGAVGGGVGAAVGYDNRDTGGRHHEVERREYRREYREIHYDHGRSGFCPPGLAKQGRC
jgi:hypothetical protein